MGQYKNSRRRKLIFSVMILFILLLTVETGYRLQRGIIKIRRREAENILYYYNDKIMLQLQGNLNEADVLAQTALSAKETDAGWFKRATAPLLKRDEVCFAFLFQGDRLTSALPANKFGNLEGKELDEFSYIFTMAKVVKDIVIEGPSVMTFDADGQEVFLFLQPIVKKNAYLGQAVVGIKRSYVLDQLGLNKLSAQGYDYELWRVEPQRGRKEMISNSRDGLDFSQAEKTEFYLPTQWNLSIQPSSGWITPAQRIGLIVFCLMLTVLLFMLSFFAGKFFIIRRTLKRSDVTDKWTALYNQKGFISQLDIWLLVENSPIMLFYFAMEGFSQTVQLISFEETKAFLKSISKRLEEYIHSPFLAGHLGNGNFLIAVREEMDEHQQESFAKGLALELLLKYHMDGKRNFLMPQYQYMCCRKAGNSAEAEVYKLIHAYYARISSESPVKALTEKCRQLIEGKHNVIFDEYTNPDMMELSKTLNRYRKQVDQLVYFDPVFNVGNRPKFLRDANTLISYDKKRRFNLFCLDICEFSQYNELFNADVGDEILHEVRRRLTRFFGSYLYRINGDVFLGISLSDENAELFADRLLKKFEFPITVKNFVFPLRVRISACQYPEHGDNPSDLIDCIQAALRFAKESEKNIVIYNDTLDEIIRTEADIIRRLKDAIEQKTLEVWYQPIILLKNGVYSSVEALVRLPDGNGGYFPAGQVVSLAERNDIVERLGDYVLCHACTFMREHGEELGLAHIGVNLSVQQLLVRDSAGHLQELIRNSGANVKQITLEITESILIQSIDQAAEALEALQQAGIHIALDDFGVGYSSLNYLSNLPVDIIKIDRSLTKQILTNFKQHMLLKSIVEMASINGLKVVVEGVELEEEQKIIAASGVHYIQGYYYARPMPEKELISFLKEKH